MNRDEVIEIWKNSTLENTNHSDVALYFPIAIRVAAKTIGLI